MACRLLLMMFNPAFFFFVGTLLFAPLAFGTAEPWSMAVLQLLVCCCCLCLVVASGRTTSAFYRVPGILPLFLLVCWFFLQVVPFPAALVRLVAPSIHEVYAPVVHFAGQDRSMPLTVNQKATVFEGLRLATYALFYVLTVQILSNGKKLRLVVNIVVVLAISVALLAILQKFSSPDKIYWFRAAPSNAQPVGPWVYHNHYAGFMEMVLPLVLALWLLYRPAVDRNRPLRNRLADLLARPGSEQYVLLGCGAVVVVASVFVSLSRGGIISMSLATALFIALLPRKVRRFRLTMYACLAGGVVILVTWFGWGGIVEKFGALLSPGQAGEIQEVRPVLWRDSLRIISDFFLTGTGGGTFFNVYPLYSSLATESIIDHAHNDYLELFTDGGLVGFVLAAWFVLQVLRDGRLKIRRRRDRFALLVTAGAMAGIGAILLHGLFDFNMQNGANGLYFFFLCGLVVAAGNTRLYFRTRPTLLAGAGPATRPLLLMAGVFLAGTAVFVRGGALLAEYNYAEIANIYLHKKLQREKLVQVAATADRAAGYDPLEGKYPFARGSALVFLRQPEEAWGLFVLAARKNPMSGVYLQRLALMLPEEEQGRAEELMRIAYARALDKESLILTWAEWLLSVNERHKAVRMLKEVFAADPLLIRGFLPVLAMYFPTREEVVEILPASVSAWYRYGALLEKRGDVSGAEFYRSRALDFLAEEDVIHPWYFSQLYRFYERQQEADKAVAVVRRALDVLPGEAEFHVYLGDYYRKEGILYRAREEYEQALLLEPLDERVRRRLAELKEVP